ncbi:efflux RND transporter permease subunit [Phorcysia thermohydrogeniphila]|uniref:Cobalt-zinc-cadmium resistance protein CzcA n=1 Tax=Phorcysia thermohydrogeniphila TaxID=936138 RepID=A0A4R1GAC5_9BACT|nr:CusA/CzcA family heavy metal efflux RND transporter [Phorcysia thermohydrogeniphila]TCK04668.1 cobalt-zinc-cadmium resistance protein CzcA [Phorcysia thermohydrogeniphila]
MLERLISFSLKNRLLVALFSVLVVVGGYFSFKKLPVDAFPDVTPVLVQVFTETHGLAPEEVEKYVTYPIETGMNGLPGLKKIRSVSNFGLSLVNLYFEDGTDIYFARQMVSERLQEVRGEIPENFGEPQLGPISTAMGLILFYYLEDTTGKYSLEELRAIQDWFIKPHLMSVPGVTEVLGIGGFEKQYQVLVDPGALRYYGLTLGDVIRAIKSSNFNVGGSFIERHGEELIVRSEGLLRGIEELRKIVVKTVNGTPIRLQDIADVRIGGAVRRGLQTKDGEKEVVAGQVIKLYGENSSTVIQRVEEKIKELNQVLPEGIRIVPYYEQKSLVEACISTVTTALGQGLVLVVAVLFLFVGGFRPSLVAAFAIPFSISFAFIGMKYFGISANLMSLGGIAIAIGMLVDGAIVFVENVDRKLKEEKGKSRIRIVAEACKEVARPVAFAILIISLVFLPIISLGGVEGKTFRPLAYSVILALAGSLLYTFLVVPALSSVFMKGEGKSTFSEKILEKLSAVYTPFGRFFIKHRLVALSVALALVVSGGWLGSRLGSEFVPKLEEGTIVLRLTMAPSISLSESKRITMLVERRLLRIPEVKSVISRIGRGEVGAHTDPVNSAEMFIILRPKETWRVKTQEELVDLIRRELGEIPGVHTNFTQPIEMAVDELLEGVRAEVAIKIFGEDLKVLKELGDRVAEVIRKVPGAVDVQVEQVIGAPQLLIRPDREKLARYGISLADVQEVIEAGVGGKVVGEVFEGLKRFDIFVRFKPEYRSDIESIGNLPVSTQSGEFIPLREVAEIKEVIGPRQITRENLYRFITVQCNVSGRDIGSFVKEAKSAIAREVELPLGYLITWGGEFELKEEADRRLRVVVPVTLALILLLLFMSFNSFRLSTLIMLNLPLALVGGITALWFTGQYVSVPALVGFIALLGIALENGMVLVSCIEQLRKEGLPVEEAALKGAVMRLRPVIMTALTSAVGLLPLLFATGTGSEIQKPLATVVVGGLVTSTFNTLFLLPALYRWFAREERSSLSAG